MKTNIKLKVKSLSTDVKLPKDPDYYRIKIDSKGSPYFVYLNEKIIISRTDFPFETKLIWGDYPVLIDIIEGIGELKKILTNKDLICNKLSLKSLFRLI